MPKHSLSRPSGLPGIGTVDWGAHLCHFYRTREDLLEILIPYMRAGLESNEACIWVASGPLTADDALEAMRKGGPDLNTYLERGQIEFLSHDQWYWRNNRFDKKLVIEGWKERIKSALKRGYEGLRVTGNTRWIEKGLWDDFIRYEREISSSIDRVRMLALCSYSLDACGPFEVSEVVSCHQYALMKKDGRWAAVENSEQTASRNELKEQERRFRLLAGYTSDLVFMASLLHEKLLIKCISDGFDSLCCDGDDAPCCADEGEPGQPSCFDAILPDDKGLFTDCIKAAFQGKASTTAVRYTGKDGRTRWISVQAFPEPNGDGAVKGVIGNVTEITAWKGAEERLLDSESRYRGLYESIMDGIVRADLEGNILDCNKAFLGMLGYSTEEVYGLTCAKITDPRWREVNKVLREQVLSRGFSDEYGIECVRKDGTAFPASIKAWLDRDGSGEPAGMWGFIRDITAQKRAEEELKAAHERLESLVEERTGELKAVNAALKGEIQSRTLAEAALKESEERLRSLIEATSDLVWEADAGWNYIYLSPKVREILGYEPSELIGRPVFDFMRPEDGKAFKRRLKRATFQKKPFSFIEKRMIGKDGRAVVLEKSAVPVLDHEGGLAGFRGIDRDVTARKAVELEKKRIKRQLIQSQKIEAIGMLAGGIAHDFNNLMGVIRLNSGFALQAPGAEKAASFIEQINMAAERAEGLTRQLLIFSKRQPTEVKSFDLNRKIAETVEMLRRVIGENIEIRTGLSASARLINADKDKVEQILMNLAVNARDAMPSGGALTITTEDFSMQARGKKLEAPGQYVKIAFEDTGTGMSGKTVKHIFKPFFTTKGPTGTGLGLAVVKDIVKELNGWIEVKSRQGSGTRFEIYLPSNPGEVEETMVRPAPVSDEKGKGERILVVEDEKFLRKSIVIVLARNGYEVREAASAREAFDIFEREGGRFDLVISDMVLQDRDGIQLMTDLKARAPGFGILITSGYLNVDSQWPAIRENGYPFLQKPYEISDLLSFVRHSLKMRQIV